MASPLKQAMQTPPNLRGGSASRRCGTCVHYAGGTCRKYGGYSVRPTQVCDSYSKKGN